MSSTSSSSSAELDRVKSLITAHPDFPLPGILFRDIFPIFQDPVATEGLLNVMTNYLANKFSQVDVVVGAAFVPVRKSGKLPGLTESISYKKEYGSDTFQIPSYGIKPGQNVVIVDDLLATGGTLKAACELVTRLGGLVLESLVVIELDDLQGRKNVPSPVHGLIHY
ncbi:adenine phosphoribosyltransferase [Capsaspora owczarzaki ATCC 30864]|uniref:adenine phosphoribosyltransferase n=1 Tax=Capsaspora owczarzaki (strain ATCC 30864) TaxID=595528 RepID=A0A0D2X4X8_CAPO3|nr:adenine phosphoribosyltransferase [Capsaspora owczarzaki ATCC 30864]KJE96834.1 adenine phosphoribosyltransferase [Capsaspora owczarzaki ATCC 30864]|eukprot:XP_004343820.2 adenine phosphoribosyltransferase [Capsaspora owczarzaki ATCC 30864]